MADKAVPSVPFEKKTKKYGTVTVIALSPNNSGGLAEVVIGDGAPFWVRAKMVLGYDLTR